MSDNKKDNNDNWKERLMDSYKLPKEDSGNSDKKNTLLTESQRNKIINQES